MKKGFIEKDILFEDKILNKPLIIMVRAYVSFPGNCFTAL